VLLLVKTEGDQKEQPTAGDRLFLLDYWSLKMKAQWFFKMSGSTNPAMQHHVPEDLSHQEATAGTCKEDQKCARSRQVDSVCCAIAVGSQELL